MDLIEFIGRLLFLLWAMKWWVTLALIAMVWGWLAATTEPCDSTECLLCKEHC